MRYHPQLFDVEELAHFYMMKDLESLNNLTDDHEDILFALQKKFNCLPYINPEQEIHMERLE